MFEDKTINIYSSRDKIREQMIDYAKDYLELEGLDFSKTSYLTYLVNILSGLTSNLLYYSTSIYKEFYLTKAVQKESILNLSAMMGYTPPYAIPSKTSVLISIPMTFSTLNDVAGSITITIPRYFRYYADDIIFTQDSEIQIKAVNVNGLVNYSVVEYPPNGGSKSVQKQIRKDNKGNPALYFITNVTQIEYLELEYTIPTQKPYEFHTINLDFEGQIAKFDKIHTRNTTTDEGVMEDWILYNSLFLIPHDIRGFAFRKTAKGGQIYFGNGVVGKQAPDGNLCLADLGITKGYEGNVISGAINKADRLYVEDYDKNTGKVISRLLNMSVVNMQPAYGGEDSPTMDEVRSNAIANLSTMKRLVSKDDYTNMKVVADELPINNSIHVIKRSDIKSNEIHIFTDIIYQDGIVPTRNAVWVFNESDKPDLTIYADDVINIDGGDYYSIFNIRVNAEFKSCYYYYLAKNIKLTTVINRTFSKNEATGQPETKVLPTTSEFNVVLSDPITGAKLGNDDQYLEVILDFELVDPTYDIVELQCYMITDWDGKKRQMVMKTVDEDKITERTAFVYEIPLSDVPEQEWTYYFKMYKFIPNKFAHLEGQPEYVPQYINESQVRTTTKQGLDEYMYSQVIINGESPNRTISVYDVPIIKKEYYDTIDQNSFNLQVLHNFLTFDVTSFRMTTDFVNLKFSDTTGALSNMRFNKITKDNVKNVNPKQFPTNPDNKERYIVTNKDNIWDREPPFIAEWSHLNQDWLYNKITTDDMVYVEDVGTKVIFNGKEVMEPIKAIPIQIYAIVWRDDSHPSTDRGLIETIKNSLIDKFYHKFTFDSDIYRSEITDVVQSVPGVEHCQVIEPKHNIFFNYDLYKDLTMIELLEYTPQLCFFDTSSITIEVR